MPEKSEKLKKMLDIAENLTEEDLNKFDEEMNGMINLIILHSFHFGILFGRSVFQDDPSLIEVDEGFFRPAAEEKMREINDGELTIVPTSSELRSCLARRGRKIEELGLSEEGIETGYKTARMIEKIIAERWLQVCKLVDRHISNMCHDED